jgi:transcriptional regulator GlxA family with amidase domain
VDLICRANENGISYRLTWQTIPLNNCPARHYMAESQGESRMANRKVVGIIIFPDVEVLDFCGPFEVFSVTRLDEAERRNTPSPFKLLLVAEHMDPVTASGGLKVLPDCTLSDCPELEVLVVPGGWGTRREINNVALIAWIAQRGRRVETLTSVCTGAMLLGRAGLLDGRRATTHWRSLAWMRESFPAVAVEEDLHVVEDGNVLTSAGVSAGIDLALHVVARYYGEAVARATARHMEYRFLEDNTRRI